MKNDYGIPRDKVEAYEHYVKTLRILGHGDLADKIVYIHDEKIVLNLEQYLVILGQPKVVWILDFVDEVV